MSHAHSLPTGPEPLTRKHVNLEVDIHSELTMGATAVDFWRVTGRPPNALWATDIDADGFYELLIDRLARL